MIEITIEDGATPALRQRLQELQNRQPLMEAAGKAVEGVLHSHFTRRDAEGNKKGWPRKHFWNRVVRRATAFSGATNDTATVKIASREFSQKLFGGTIRAGSGKFLAIPLTARAYAVGRPRNWTGTSLHVLRLSSGKLLLRENLHSSLKGRKRDRGKRIEGGEAQYLLVKSVKQKADPNALPSTDKMTRAARIVVADYLARRAA
jgi:hypothetical protein